MDNLREKLFFTSLEFIKTAEEAPEEIYQAIKNELIEKYKEGTWQYDYIFLMLQIIDKYRAANIMPIK